MRSRCCSIGTLLRSDQFDAAVALLFDGYDSISRGVLVSLDYALTDRVSFTIGVPYIGSK